MKIKFKAYRPLQWDPNQRQPVVFLTDEREKPLSIPSVNGSEIYARSEEPVHLHLRWPVDGFGEITLRTDFLEPKEKTYNLNIEIARCRINLLDEKVNEWAQKGFDPGAEYLNKMKEAREIFTQAEQAITEDVKARWADLSLSISVPAGEQMALDYGNWGIEQRKKSKGFKNFKWGTFAIQNYDYNEEETRLFKELINLGSIPVDWGTVEKVKGQIDWPIMDKMIDWLIDKGIEVKGQPLFWIYDYYMPDWIDYNEKTEFLRLTKERLHTIVGRYKDKIKFWDVTNELNCHNPYRDIESAVELTKFCCDAVREADPDAICAVNTNYPFGEFMPDKDPKSVDFSLGYFERLLEAGVDFDVAEIQVYHGAAWTQCRDLFEMSRHCDKYESLGKPVILSELGVPSSEEFDPQDRYNIGEILTGHKKDERSIASYAGFWHGPWNEQRQAEWMDGFCRILMGKNFMEGIVFFDYTDRLPHFYPHAGLLDANGKPKEVYYRLLELKTIIDKHS